ncbi:MAG: hypothetical protein Q4G69_09345 [Planctomycetia bacterium]|nr:hypothetical protein [Planctomycetia bacterium]
MSMESVLYTSSGESHRSAGSTRLSNRNPFSVRYVQPGVVPFFFERSFLASLEKEDPLRFEEYFAESILSGESVKTELGYHFLADLLEKNHWFSQIVGPHGSGKTTLMCGLASFLKEKDVRILYFALHDDQASIPDPFRKELDDFAAKKGKRNLFFLDGYEQLSLKSKLEVRWFCKRMNLGLLISTHKTAWGIPVLFRTTPTSDLLYQIVDYLLDEPEVNPPEFDYNRLFHDHGGNIRDALFSLYDEFEDQPESFYSRCNTARRTIPR